MDAHNEALIVRSFLDLTLQVSGLSAACAVRVSNGAQFWCAIPSLLRLKYSNFFLQLNSSGSLSAQGLAQCA